MFGVYNYFVTAAGMRVSALVWLRPGRNRQLHSAHFSFDTKHKRSIVLQRTKKSEDEEEVRKVCTQTKCFWAHLGEGISCILTGSMDASGSSELVSGVSLGRGTHQLTEEPVKKLRVKTTSWSIYGTIRRLEEHGHATQGQGTLNPAKETTKVEPKGAESDGEREDGRKQGSKT